MRRIDHYSPLLKIISLQIDIFKADFGNNGNTRSYINLQPDGPTNDSIDNLVGGIIKNLTKESYYQSSI